MATFYRAKFAAAVATTILVIASPPADAGDAGTVRPAAEPTVRICTDLSTIDGASWYPHVSLRDGDPIATEIAVDLANRLTLRDPRLTFFGIAQTYETIVASAKNVVAPSTADIVEAQYYLRALLVPVRQGDGIAFNIKLWLEDSKTHETRDSLARSSLAESEDAISPKFGDLVTGLIAAAKGGGSSADAYSKSPVLAEFSQYRWSYHMAVARSRVHRLMGRRFGDPEEKRLLGIAESDLREASALRDGKPASAFETIEETALFFRLSNVSNQTDMRWTKERAPALDDLSTKWGRDFPDLYFWRALAQQDGYLPGEAADSFKAALSVDDNSLLGNKLDNVYFNRAVDRRGMGNDFNPLRDYEIAVKLNPANLRARTYLARARVDAEVDKATPERFQELMHGYDAAVSSFPDYPLAVYHKALLLWRYHDPERGRDTLKDALITVDRLLGLPGFYRQDAQVLRLLMLVTKQDWNAVAEELFSDLDSDEKWHWFVEAYRAAASSGKRGTPEGHVEFSRLRDRLEEQLAAQPTISPFQYGLLSLLAAELGESRVAMEFASVTNSQLKSENPQLNTPQRIRERSFAYVTAALSYHLAGDSVGAQAMSSVRSPIP